MEGLDFKYALSHILVSGISIWCIYHTKKCDELLLVILSYGIILVYALIGVWRYGNPLYGPRSANLYELMSTISTCIVFPIAVYEVYILYGYNWQYALVHVLIPVLPLLVYLTSIETKKSLINFGLIGNILSLLGMSIVQQNYFGIASAVSYTLNQFVLRVYEFGDTPRKVIYNIGVCHYLYFMYKTLCEAHVKCFHESNWH